MKAEPIPVHESIGFDVLVIGASAGGQTAVIAILRDLPLDFDVPIVVVQHLPPQSRILDVYARRLPFSFEWIDADSRLAPRKVLVCPARVCGELLPDGSFRLESCEGAIDKQIDRLLHSVARSYSHRAIGVVLTGMGDDGAAGARALHATGGRILVQSASSAEYPEMPRAALAAGAADLVVPLGDIAQVLTDLVDGAVRPKGRSELDAIERVFSSEGEIAALAREVDWSRTSIGPALQWPHELRLIVRMAIESPHPTAVWWGRDLVQFHNPAWRRFLGSSKHPQALGAPARETWGEIWSDVGPMVERVLQAGVAAHREDFVMVIDRHGYAEEVIADFGCSPIRDAKGTVLGVHISCRETTSTVVAERRIAALRALTAQVSGARTPRQAGEQAAAALAAHPLDLPFALLYLFDAPRRQATLAGAAGIASGSVAAPHTIALVGAQDTWALQRLVASAATTQPAGVLLEDLERRVPGLAPLLGGPPGGPAPRGVYVLPVRSTEKDLPTGALVAGLNPLRPFDEGYRSFVELVAGQISAGLIEARATELERERRERLAELDRAKTEFFANVSHEFRTPLTLLLSPLDEMLRRRGELPPALAPEIEVAARNSRRLLRLVDSLLDFSQLEQRRQRAMLQATDLGALTSDIASAFRSAIERAGLTLRVQCESSLPLVAVDRDMWEKVVSNLLSNALKFTFQGEIVVRLHALALHVELVVSDTGVGIAKHELPNIFKRFHRVRGAKARTIDGSGIGLALVHDLVTRMGGQMQVWSSEGRGTAFTVWMPLKSVRQSFDDRPATDEDAPAVRIAAGLAEQADTWIEERATADTLDDLLGAPKGEPLRLAPGARILVADDNADLRVYLRRLLGTYWNVTAVADGAQALEAARDQRPDLILADVMMPNVDGFALLRAVRADPALQHVPVVLLTARAGADMAVEGLLAGADDYLAKPFSARELIARVGGQLELARVRRRAEAILERMGDAHCVLDREFRIVGVNAAAERLLGQPRADLLGRSHWDAFPASVDLPVGRAFRRVVDEGVEQHLLHHYTGEGYDLHLELDAYPTDEGGVAMFWRDATERVRAKAALETSEEKYRALFNEMDEAYAVVELIADAAGRWTDFRFLEVNPVFMRHTGMPYPVGRTATELLGTPNPRWAELYGRAAETGESIRLEEDELTLGRVFDLNIFRLGGAGNRRVAVLFTDITERKRAEATLRTNEALMRGQKEALQAVLDGAPLAASLGLLTRLVVAETGGKARTAFCIADPDGAALHPVRGAGDMPDDYLDWVDGFVIGRDSLACGLAVSTDQAVVTPDVFEEPRWAPWTHIARAHDYRGCWSFPIRTAQDKAVGTFAMYFRAPREATPDDLALADVVTQTAAVIIVNHQQAQERARAEAALRASEQRRLLGRDATGTGD